MLLNKEPHRRSTSIFLRGPWKRPGGADGSLTLKSSGMEAQCFQMRLWKAFETDRMMYLVIVGHALQAVNLLFPKRPKESSMTSSSHLHSISLCSSERSCILPMQYAHLYTGAVISVIGPTSSIRNSQPLSPWCKLPNMLRSKLFFRESVTSSQAHKRST